MAREGAYILDVNLLEQLNDRIKYSGEKMADIDQNVINHINNVGETLEGQLNIIQTKLNEARVRLSEAESALQACEAMQAATAAMGLPGPTCMLEAGAVAEARAEVAKWEMRYAQGQQIVAECQQEIAGYNAGGHVLISNMSNQQTPKACQLLYGCSDNLQDILNSDVDSLPKETAVVGGTGIDSGVLFGDINKPKDTTRLVPISNGCGPESSSAATFAANWIGRPVDAILTGTSIKAQNAVCDRHDIDQYNGSPTADADFRKSAEFMGAMVEGDVKGAGDAFGKAVTKVCEKTGGAFCDTKGRVSSSVLRGVYKAGKLPSEEEIKEINKQSQLSAQKDREIHKNLKPVWEEEKQQCLDPEVEKKYRVDVEEGGASKL